MMRAPLHLLLLLLLCPAALAAEKRPWRFEGREQADVDDLEEAAARDLARFRRRRGEASADDAAFELQAWYRRSGFPRARVDYRVEERRAVFQIEEGPRVFLAGVEISGTKFADPEKIAAFVKVPSTGLLGLGSRLWVHADLESSGQRMRAWLRQHGFLEAEVTLTADPPIDSITAKEGEAKALYEVAEGRPHRLSGITLEGVREEFRAEILGKLREASGAAYTPITPFELEAAVVRRYGRHGFPFTEVRVEEQEHVERPDEVLVPVRVVVVEGRKGRIARVDVVGNVRTKDRVVRRELEFAPRDAYDVRAFSRSRGQLYDTGLFRQVNLNLLPPAEPPPGDGPVDVGVQVRLEENDFTRLETSVGFGSWELLRGSVGWQWLNLAGTARTLGAKVAVSMRGFGISVTGTDPWLFGRRLEGAGEIAFESEERPTFVYQRLGAGASVTRQLDRKLLGSLGYRYDVTEVTKVSGDLPPAFETTTNLSSITAGLTYESRDRPWTPREGSHVSGSLQVATRLLGGELDFLRLRVNAVRVLPLGDFATLVGHLEAGAIRTYGNTDEIPIQERFFLGGGQTVRSFGEADLGPRLPDSDAAAGGEYMSLANLELRIPVWGGLEGAVFADAGNVIENLEDADLSGYRLAFGAGVRYSTPLGPVRVDFGVNPTPRSYEDRWAIFLAVGYPF